jgi:hypothetical protein
MVKKVEITNNSSVIQQNWTIFHSSRVSGSLEISESDRYIRIRAINDKKPKITVTVDEILSFFMLHKIYF